VNSKVYESLIKSDFRMTYKEVDQVLTPPSIPPLSGEGSS